MNSRAVLLAVLLIVGGMGVTFWLGARYRADVRPGNLESIAANPDKYGIPADEDDPLPKAVVDAEEYDFGKMLLGTTGTHKFSIKNEGEDVLKVKKGPSTCKCTLSDLPDDTVVDVAPGDSISLTLEWTPKGIEEVFSHAATVWTSDKERREISFRVSGAVTSEVELHPSEILNAGSVVEDEGADAVLYISSTFFENLPEPTVTLSSEYVESSVSPLTESDREYEHARGGYKIAFHVKPTVPVGNFREIAKIRMNSDEVNVEREITIEARRSGPISFFPQGETVFYNSIQLIDMGHFDASEGKRAELVLMIEKADDGSEIEITDVAPSVKLIQTSAVPDETLNKQFAKKNAFRITVEIPPGTLPIDFARQTAPKIVVKTTHQTVAEIVLRLEAHSR